MKRLSELEPTQSGKIKKIESLDLTCVQRLMVMGFVEGSNVKYVSSMYGNPIEVVVEGSRISISADCASHFFVEIV